VQAYKARGIESFGIIEHGSCGYTLSDGTLAYQRDMYAALAGEGTLDVLASTSTRLSTRRAAAVKSAAREE
jgi:hypothetical protein